ncbi:2-oxoacid:acceptor oxidoreductase family protein, partial [Intestinimonas sp.]|uniref:2-oxoacid:acceptor oxidoreductase family protein n=1 Tax=Intestinimonas sp. TaxID=1965293 RepID=UPI002617B5FD
VFPMFRDVKDGGTFLINCQCSDEEINKHMPAVAKRYIAEHNIQVYTIDAIDLAAKIGMGKRTNTILQSAFFKLAKVMPEAEAIGYMKDAATHSYLKKGQDVVDMNHKAIDMGATAFKKFNVPADWANAVDEKKDEQLEGRAATVKMVRDIMEPVGRMDGDSLPVSAFAEGHADGTFEQGAAAYEKRGVAVNVPVWDATKCIQCNQCSYVCPHATIRPYALTEEEAKNAPANAKIVDVKAGKGKGVYKFALAVSPLDCMGCGVCVGVCPVNALEMVPQESQAAEQAVFDYMVAKVSDKADMADTTTVKGSQFNQPLLEFSGSCAGCAETSYARLITQVCGDRMYISNATGCSSIWGGPAATSPYTVNKAGHGPAWANSLFEDNAEHGLGFFYGQKALRDRLIGMLTEWSKDERAPKAEIEKFLETKDDGAANAEPARALLAAAEKAAAEGCPYAKEILEHKEFLAKKSIWIFGGDGWAYDIGYGGLDHVLASGEDVNVFVFDTEVYSNTGGQASKATNVGAVAQFAAAGKTMPKKSLAEIAMQYGYVYVAQVAMGANPAQTLKAINEAESYHGPSLIIGYAPCEMHSIKGGMTNCQSEMKKAVECGYWNLFRFNPALKAEGKSPFTLDSKAPAGGYQEFLMNEARYSALTRAFPDRAEKLFQENEALAKARYEHLLKLQELYA